MALNKKHHFSAQYFFCLFSFLLIVGCASIQRPEGGPRDKTAPKLLKATPANKTRNFNAKEIRLEFDEYFKLNNQYQEIVVSPAQEKAPEFKIRQKSLVIEFQDTLQKNTTYVINFGKAIADVNESNELKNFTYVFSTGSQIDSLMMSGNVVNTETQKPEKDATVFILPLSQDSAMFGKKKPSIFATTDSSGNFSLTNLHAGDYRIYALRETSPNRIFDNDAELIGFAKNTIRLNRDTSNIRLRLFKQTPEAFRVLTRKFDPDGKMIFIFNKPLPNLNVKIIDPPQLDAQKIVDYGVRRDTALVYMRTMDFDSVKVAVLEGNMPLDTITLRKGRKETFTRNLNVAYNINGNVLRPNTDLAITANYPLTNINQSRIVLNEDSIPVNNFTLQKDADNPKRFLIKYRWVPNRIYDVILNEGALTTVYSDKNKRTFKQFKLDKPENYGILSLKVSIPDTSVNYVVELTNADQKGVLRTDVVTKSTVLTYLNYPTGKYRVRVIYDNNRNGRWDSGNVKQRIQPENIWLYDKDITLRPNWDAEEPIDIPKQVITP